MTELLTKRNLLIAARLFFGLLTLFAIAVQLSIHIGLRFDVVNFFSYFTNLSNIFAAVVLVVGGVYLIRGRESTPRDDNIRGAATVGMVIVGLVFGALLRDVDLGSLQPWINVVVHYVMPIVVLADWLLLPPRSPIALRQLVYWLIFPLLYLVYTLTRGAITGFYPYPFLNPAKADGYGSVALYSLGIFVTFLVVGWLLVTLGNRLPRRL